MDPSYALSEHKLYILKKSHNKNGYHRLFIQRTKPIILFVYLQTMMKPRPLSHSPHFSFIQPLCSSNIEKKTDLYLSFSGPLLSPKVQPELFNLRNSIPKFEVQIHTSLITIYYRVHQSIDYHSTVENYGNLPRPILIFSNF